MSRAVYFFPHAGAYAANFKEWHTKMKPEVLLIPIDYAGHGRLKNRQFYNSVLEAVDDIYLRIKKDTKRHEKYYLAGQCLGVIIAYELYFKIIKEKEIELPEGLFFIGQGAPNNINCIPFSKMDRKDILNKLYNEGNLDKSMLDDSISTIVDALVINPLKADSKIYEQYELESNKGLLQVNTHIFYGENDSFYKEDEFKNWSLYIDGDAQYHIYEGGHNFYLNSTDNLLNEIKNIINGK